MSTASGAVQNSVTQTLALLRWGVVVPRPILSFQPKTSALQQQQCALSCGTGWSGRGLSAHARTPFSRRARHVAHGATQQGMPSAEPVAANAFGASPTGLRSATPATANAPIAAPLLAGGLGGEQPQLQTSVLFAAEALLAASPMGLDLLSAPAALPTELRVSSGNSDMSAARPAFVSSSSMAPVIAPGGWAGGPADSPAGSVTAAAAADAEVLVVVPPGVSAMAVDLGITGHQQQQQQQQQPELQHGQSPATSSAATSGNGNGNGNGNIHATAAADAAAASTAAAAAAAIPTHQEQQPQQGQGSAGSLLDRLKAAVASIQWGKLWALALLSVSYVHQATTGFALPAMLPMISNELHLTDLQVRACEMVIV